MSTISRVTTWNSGDTLTASDLNGEFNNIVNDYNGSIVNANISSTAAIAASKISGTAATLTGTETLTNKTLTNPTITGHQATVTSDTDGATITFDLDAGPIHTVTLGGNRTLAVSNAASGKVFYVVLTQDGTGSRTVTWWASINWTGAAAPTLTTTASRADIFAFFYDGSNYYGSIVGQNYG